MISYREITNYQFNDGGCKTMHIVTELGNILKRLIYPLPGIDYARKVMHQLHIPLEGTMLEAELKDTNSASYKEMENINALEFYFEQDLNDRKEIASYFDAERINQLVASVQNDQIKSEEEQKMAREEQHRDAVRETERSLEQLTKQQLKDEQATIKQLIDNQNNNISIIQSNIIEKKSRITHILTDKDNKDILFTQNLATQLDRETRETFAVARTEIHEFAANNNLRVDDPSVIKAEAALQKIEDDVAKREQRLEKAPEVMRAAYKDAGKDVPDDVVVGHMQNLLKRLNKRQAVDNGAHELEAAGPVGKHALEKLNAKDKEHAEGHKKQIKEFRLGENSSLKEMRTLKDEVKQLKAEEQEAVKELAVLHVRQDAVDQRLHTIEVQEQAQTLQSRPAPTEREKMTAVDGLKSKQDEGTVLSANKMGDEERKTKRSDLLAEFDEEEPRSEPSPSQSSLEQHLPATNGKEGKSAQHTAAPVSNSGIEERKAKRDDLLELDDTDEEDKGNQSPPPAPHM